MKPKLYTYGIEGVEQIQKRAKGVKSNTVKREIQREDYKSCLVNFTFMFVDQNFILSK